MWLTLSRQLLSRNKSPISTLPATCVLPVCQLVILWLSLLVSSAWCRVILLFLVRTKKREREGSTLVAFWRLVDFVRCFLQNACLMMLEKGGLSFIWQIFLENFFLHHRLFSVLGIAVLLFSWLS